MCIMHPVFFLYDVQLFIASPINPLQSRPIGPAGCAPQRMEINLNRRHFLKAMAVTTGALAGIAITSSPIKAIATALIFPSPVRLSIKGKILQGTQDGQILESTDAGKTWQKIANFGSHCSILDLMERGGLVYVQVGLQNHSFVLRSTDGRTWLTG